MRKFLLIILLLLACKNNLKKEIWYVYSFKSHNCEIAEIQGESAGPLDLIKHAPHCFVSRVDGQHGLVVVDCTHQKDLEGYVYYATTEKSCTKYYKNKHEII